MPNNQKIYTLSNVTLNKNEINNIIYDYNLIMKNWNDPNISITVKKYELAQYYTDQGFSRSYTIQASNVVLNQNDLNGNVANSNINNYYKSIGVNFTEQVRLNVSYNLIQEDFKLLQEQDFIVPNESEITYEHNQVFNKLGIPMSYWGGSIFANNNQDFESGINNSAETINNQNMSQFMSPNTSNRESFKNLFFATFSKNINYKNVISIKTIYELLGDTKNLIMAAYKDKFKATESITTSNNNQYCQISVTDTSGNNLLSLSSWKNSITYSVGNIQNKDINDAISNITIKQNNNIMSLNYTNEKLNQININNTQWVINYTKDTIYHNGQLYNNQGIADVLNQALIIDKVKNNLGLVHKYKDPIIFDITGKGFHITPFTTINDYHNINNASPISQKMQWIGDGSYFLISINNHDQPTYYTSNTLKLLDTNGDGIINANDTSFSDLYLWNGQTFTSANTLTLTQAGILSISLKSSPPNSNDADGSTIMNLYNVSSSSGLIQAAEINLQADPTYTLTNIDQAITNGTLSTTITINGQSIDLSILPNLHGYGTLSSILGTMATNDTWLVRDIQNFNNLNLSTSWATISNDVRNILYEWGNHQTSQFTLPNGTSGPTQFTATNANKELAFLDNYTGSIIYFDTTTNNSSMPNTLQQKILNSTFNLIQNDAIAKLAIQGPYKILQKYFNYIETNDTITKNNTDANTLQTIMNQYITTYTPNYNNNTGTDSATTFWQIVSALFQASENSINEDAATEFNNLKTINNNMAQYIVNSGQGMSIETPPLNGSPTNSNSKVVTDIMGDQTIVWSGDNNTEIVSNDGNLLQQTFYHYVNNYIYTQGQKGNNNLPEFKGLQSDNLILNTSLSNVQFSIGGTNCNDLLISKDNYVLALDHEINITKYIFNDQTISETINTNQTGYNYIGKQNNGIMLGLNSRVTYDTKGYTTNIYNVSDFNNIIFNQGYQTINLETGATNLIINANIGLTAKNTSITWNGNDYIINFNTINTGNINAHIAGSGKIEINYANGDKSILINNSNIINNGENDTISQSALTTISFTQNISYNDITYNINNNILNISYINPTNNKIVTINDTMNHNETKIQLSGNQYLDFMGTPSSQSNPLYLNNTGMIINSLGQGSDINFRTIHNDYTTYSAEIFDTGYQTAYTNIYTNNFHIFLRQNINITSINLSDTSGDILLKFTDTNDITNNTGNIDITNKSNSQYMNTFIILNNQTYSLVYGLNETPSIIQDITTTTDNQTINANDPNYLNKNIIINNNNDTINYQTNETITKTNNTKNKNYYIELDNAHQINANLNISLNKISISYIDAHRFSISTTNDTDDTQNIITSFDQNDSFGMLKSINLYTNNGLVDVFYGIGEAPTINPNAILTNIFYNSQPDGFNITQFYAGDKNLILHNNDNTTPNSAEIPSSNNINLHQNPSYNNINYSLTNTNQVTINFTDQADITAGTGNITINTENNGDIRLNNIGPSKQSLELPNASTHTYITQANNEIINTLDRTRNITVNNTNVTIIANNNGIQNITDNVSGQLNIQFNQNISSSNITTSKTGNNIIDIQTNNTNNTEKNQIIITDNPSTTPILNLIFKDKSIILNPSTYTFSNQNNNSNTTLAGTSKSTSLSSYNLNTIQNTTHQTQTTSIVLLNNQ